MTNAVCFTCGLGIENPAKLSRLTNGQVCPACRDRVLDGLPAALPARPASPAQSLHAAEERFTAREEVWGRDDEDHERGV